MSPLIRIAWRNIWRSLSRSTVLLCAITAGLWAGIMISALTNGLIEQRFANLIEKTLSHVQVHHPDFLAEREVDLHLHDEDALLAFVQEHPKVRAYTARTLTDGMIQSPVTTEGVTIRGVLPGREQATTGLADTLVDGDYLDVDSRNPLLIGKRLAQQLNVGIGNRVVLTFQDSQRELVSASFNIVGIFTADSSQEERGQVFTTAEVLGSYIGGDARYHEVALLLHDEHDADAMAAELNARHPDNRAQTWAEISPELRYLAEIGTLSTVIMMGVILVALAFGILNTMLMSMFERTRELGMLMAIGMNKRKVFTMITLESVFLTLTGTALGMALALLTIRAFSDHGLNFERFGGDALREIGYDAIVVPVMSAQDYLIITAMVVITAILAALYPAIKALHLKPAEAVKA